MEYPLLMAGERQHLRKEHSMMARAGISKFFREMRFSDRAPRHFFNYAMRARQPHL
jgi:hypothetical protein